MNKLKATKYGVSAAAVVIAALAGPAAAIMTGILDIGV